MSDFKLPGLFARFLAWLLNDSRESGLGDFQEYYGEIAAESGPSRAAWMFRGQVLAMTPGRLLEKFRQGMVMLRNYLTLAVRHFRKQKLASTINVFGLSIAVGCCVTVFLMLNGYMNMNAEHEFGDRLYLVEQTIEQTIESDGENEVWGSSPMPLGPAVAADVAGVERSVRMSGRSATLYVDEVPFENWVVFAEPGFMDVFSFPLSEGTGNPLIDLEQVILSDSEAKRLFGDEPAMGREFAIVLNDGRIISATVAGVAEPFATSAGVRFGVLMNLDRIADEGYADWTADTGATLLMLREGVRRADVEEALSRYVGVHNAADPAQPVASFGLDNIQSPNPGAWRVRNRMIEALHPVIIAMLLAIPGFMLALSCFNYINISLGAANRRLREIGVRKVVGGSRSQLIMQFLGENLFLTFLSLLLGIVIAFLVLIPVFNSVLVNQIVFVAGDLKSLVGFLVVLLLGVALISGAYPAFYISAFQPIQVLRARIKISRRSWVSSSLLTAQFVLAFLTVILSVYLSMNVKYMVSQDWGYDPAGVLSVRVSSEAEASVMMDRISQMPRVTSVTTSVDQVGLSVGRSTVGVAGEQIDVRSFAVGAGYLGTLGLKLAEGRGFDAQFEGDQASSVLVNESFVRQQGWDRPLAESVRIAGAERNVVGVVRDFLISPIQSDLPTVMTRAGSEETRYVSIRVSGVSARGMLETVRNSWKEAFPDRPFDAAVQSEVFDARFQSFGNVVRAFSYLSLLALAIACLGLFGLASQNMAYQLKDVSVRKVLGASRGHLAVLVNRRFIWMLIIAGALATLVTVAGYTALLTLPRFKIQHLAMAPSLFAVAYLVVGVTAALALGTQTRQVLQTDPAEVLRGD
ncbi:MAG: putative ABC transport system permease protein [Rhodothermales bacterium]|jgi:putative ABC transport system permease protein